MKRGTKTRSGASGAIRIISGQWRGRKLPVLDADGLRPTTDRTKETLFNWLMQDIRDARVLDVFAGSGSLGIESLSRYAKRAVFIERDKRVAANLKDNLNLLGCSQEQAVLINEDANNALSGLSDAFDLVFIDPPFNKGMISGTIETLDRNQLIENNGLIYIESEIENSDYPVPEQWNLVKEKATRQVAYRLYQFRKE